jgi:CHAT domain-containing protein
MNSEPSKRALLARAAIICGLLTFPPSALGQAGGTAPAIGQSYIGVEVRELTARDNARSVRPAPRGVLIKKVTPGSPAAEANLHHGDIVTRMGRKPVVDVEAFSKAIGAIAPGTVIKVEVLRRGRLRTAPVKLSLSPGQAANIAGSVSKPFAAAPAGAVESKTKADPEKAQEAASGKSAQAFKPAQTQTQTPASARTSEIAQLDRAWREARDPEPAIQAAEALLTLEAQAEAWPLAEPRLEYRARLLKALGQAYSARREGARAANREKSYEAAKELLAIVSREAAPERWADAQDNLCGALRQRVSGNAAENIEQAIAACGQALTVYARETAPDAWAETQHHLGLAWTERTAGAPQDNFEKAIAAFEAALTVRTREASAANWAETQHALAVARRQLTRGDREENIERAISAFEAVLTVYTREANPKEWAAAKHQLAVATRNRVRGDKAENKERAIALYEEALSVRTREAMPDGWAQTQTSLSTAYSFRARGAKEENVERAHAAAEAALTVYTREDFPREWALAQYTLTTALERRTAGDKGDNLERAIAAYRAALTVYTKEAYPNDWAMTQYALASTYEDRTRGDPAENIDNAIEAAQAALTVRTREAEPEKWARGMNMLARLYRSRMRGSKIENSQRSVAALEDVISAFPRDKAVGEWAQAQCGLAASYLSHPLLEAPEIAGRAIAASEACLGVSEQELPANLEWLVSASARGPVLTLLADALANREQGDRAENLERAIEAAKSALALYPRGEAPALWAEVTGNLAKYYTKRVRGNRAANIEQAIDLSREALSVFSRERFPVEWGTIQGNICYAYQLRLQGAMAENIEKAIAACKDALSALNPKTAMAAWVNAQNNLAGAYRLRPRGEQAENTELAIAGLEAALEAISGETSPRQLAQIQLNLSVMYADRAHGSRTENIERAIGILEKAIPASPREQEPERWAYNLQNKAGLLLLRIKGDPEDNLARAIEALEGASSVLVREQYPQRWGKVQLMLASAYGKRTAGSAQENIDKAIQTAEAALTLLTPESYPAEWAAMRMQMAAHYTSPRLGRASPEAIARAIAACQDALTVFTRDAYPGGHRLAASMLGSLYLKLREWRKADDSFKSAREAFLLQFGEGLNEADAQQVLTEDLFTDAAYAASQLGDNERAFALLDEGKARLLGVALKLGHLDLDAASLERLQALRSRISQSEAIYQAMSGQEKSSAIAALTGLRQELLALVLKGSRAGEDVLARAASVAPEGGALVAPLGVNDGAAYGLQGKFLAVTAKDGHGQIAAVEMPAREPARDKELGEAFSSWAKMFQPGLPEAERTAALENLPAALAKMGPGLWEAHGQTLDAVLKQAGVKQGAPIVVLPLGASGLLPIGLAENPDTRRRLMDDYPIAFAPSISTLVSAKERVGAAPADPSLTAIVNPTGDLEFTPVEAALVSSHFGEGRRGSLVKEGATPDNVLKSLANSDYWHFASHGFFDRDDPKSSGLLMAGMQPLTARMLATAEGLKGPRLAVLSACETGIYGVKNNANEFVGLPSALLRLGAGGVVSSLWPVNDLSTALLLAKFFDLHRGEGLSPAVALQKAQIWLRDATAADLRIYVERAIGERRLTADLAGGLRDAIRSSSPARGLVTEVARMLRGEAKSEGAIDSTERPFANPYYWSGFVLTGM